MKSVEVFEICPHCGGKVRTLISDKKYCTGCGAIWEVK